MEIDLNADMGESFGMYKLGNDEEFMSYITSANIACGYHAGDPGVMKETVALAKKFGVQVGAHPGLPDLQGFGRREMKLGPEEVYTIILYQVGALKAFTDAAGIKLHHVKPHGSLYGMAHKDNKIARSICQAILDIDPQLFLYVMKKGVIVPIAEKMGVRTICEMYSDLGYDADGNLVITRTHKAHNHEQAALRVKRMVLENKVISIDGKDIAINGNSVCVHSDSPGSLEIVVAVRSVLEKSNCTISSPER